MYYNSSSLRLVPCLYTDGLYGRCHQGNNGYWASKSQKIDSAVEVELCMFRMRLLTDKQQYLLFVDTEM